MSLHRVRGLVLQMNRIILICELFTLALLIAVLAIIFWPPEPWAAIREWPCVTA